MFGDGVFSFGSEPMGRSKEVERAAQVQWCLVVVRGGGWIEWTGVEEECLLFSGMILKGWGACAPFLLGRIILCLLTIFINLILPSHPSFS